MVAAEDVDAGGRLVVSGFVETHIHLDKSCILDRCRTDDGDLASAIAKVSEAKLGFTPEDVAARATRTLEMAILNGTTHMRTHLEVDPKVGLRSFAGVKQAIRDHAWAIDVEICVFPQEGLLNNPGTDELMVAALEDGATVVGGAPYTDSDPHGQIDRIFELARIYDADIDLHLDFGPDGSDLDALYVCEKTTAAGWGGRVAIGHVTKLSNVTPDRLAEVAGMLADAGVALTVLPSTDLFLMGRHQDHGAMRGVTPAHKLLGHGVNCSLSTNNVLNPFTPFGDCSQVRMANLYANICHVGRFDELAECLEMVTNRPARLMRIADYGIAVGRAADLVVLDAPDRVAAVTELASPLYGFKRGRRTFTRQPPVLHRPQ
jgi:cytosine deaminase